jgi:hypothetical protein
MYEQTSTLSRGHLKAQEHDESGQKNTPMPNLSFTRILSKEQRHDWVTICKNYKIRFISHYVAK